MKETDQSQTKMTTLPVSRVRMLPAKVEWHVALSPMSLVNIITLSLITEHPIADSRG